MNKRLEDRLIQLAFEERSDAGMQQVADLPEAAARLREYQSIKTALGQLRDLPEHQMSTERLREALLHRGLKRRAAFPWQAIGYGATATALFVCAFVASRDIRKLHNPAPQVVADGPSIASLFSYPAQPTVAGTAQGSSQVVATQSRSTHWVHRGGDDSGGSRDVAYNGDTRETPISDFVEDRNQPTRTTAPNSTVNAGSPVTGAPSGSARPAPVASQPVSMTNAVVLIQPKTDADTGLDTAQEVSASSDVLVGG